MMKSFAVFRRCPPMMSLWKRQMTTEASLAQGRREREDLAVVVVGGGRGIGLGIVRELLDSTKNMVYVLVRDPQAERSSDLHSLIEDRNAHERCKVLRANPVEESSIQPAVEEVENDLKARNGAVRLLFNSSGMLHNKESGQQPEKTMRDLSADWLIQAYKANTIAHIIPAKYFVPLLEVFRKQQKDALRDNSPQYMPPVIASITGRVGSIEDNVMGGWYSYRMAKAATNMALKNMSIELGRKQMAVLSLHPGTVDTALSEPFSKNVKPEKLFSVEYSAGRLLQICDEASLRDNGSFKAYDGEIIPW